MLNKRRLSKDMTEEEIEARLKLPKIEFEKNMSVEKYKEWVKDTRFRMSFAYKENTILRKNVYDLEIQLREARKRISELLATKDD